MAMNKTQPTDASVSKFFRSLSGERARADCETLVALMRAATKSEPRMWGPSIVGFGEQRLRYASGREGDWFVVGFSPRKAALVLYSLHPKNNKALLATLGKHKTGGGCLYIRSLDDVDLKVLKALIVASVKTI